MQDELSGVKDQIMASLRMNMSVGKGHGGGVRIVREWRMLLLLMRTKVRKRWLRRARGGKSGGREGLLGGEGGYGTSVNMHEVEGILKGLSKEDRGRCMRSAEIDDELSSMSGRNSATDPGIFVIFLIFL